MNKNDLTFVIYFIETVYLTYPKWFHLIIKLSFLFIVSSERHLAAEKTYYMSNRQEFYEGLGLSD